MKYVVPFAFLCFFYTGTSQTFYGFEIKDFLVSADHPYGCVDNYVTGLPDDSTWVNFDDGDIMTGEFGMSWSNRPGNDLLLETSYHADNYRVRLILSTGLYTIPVSVSVADWTRIPDTSWVHIFTQCWVGEIPASRWILPLDFDRFGVNAGDLVSGIAIIFLDTDGAPDLAGVYIIEEPCTNFSLGPDKILCDGNSLTLNATTANASYVWQDNSTGPTLIVTEPGTYWVNVTIDQCEVVDTIHILDQSIDVDIGNDTTLCPGETLVLHADTPGATYQWQDNTITSTYTVTSPGMYAVTVMVDDCESSDTILINYADLPGIDLGNDTVLCGGETLLLNAILPDATYAWQDGSNEPDFLVTGPDTYWVNATIGNCMTGDTIEVDYIIMPPLSLGADTTLCEGESLVLGNIIPGATYQWQDNSDQPAFEATEAGEYWVTANIDRCQVSDTIQINIHSVLQFDLGNDTTICDRQILLLDPGVGEEASFRWQDNSQHQTFTVIQNGTYWVEVENECGVSTDTIAVKVEDCSCRFFVPNVFTPNGDLVNDEIKPSAGCELSDFLFMIFDRAGNQFFVTHEYGKGWDGTYKDHEAQSGVYAYVIIYTFQNGIQQSQHGDITLLR